MKRTIIPFQIFLFYALILSSSCTNTESINPDKLLAEASLLNSQVVEELGIDLEVYTYQDLYVGYNKIELVLKERNTGSIFRDAEIAFKPIMDMGTMKHASPVENPVFSREIDDVYSGAVVFVMPSGDMGTWTLDILIKNNLTTAEATVNVPIDIKMPVETRMKSFLAGSEKYFVSLVQPADPGVGINDFEIVIHKKMSMMDWPFESGFSLLIEPEMPTMGHGSPNNVHPVHNTIGHYMGAVNFTMDGYWKVNLTLQMNDHVESMSFDITFASMAGQ